MYKMYNIITTASVASVIGTILNTAFFIYVQRAVRIATVRLYNL